MKTKILILLFTLILVNACTKSNSNHPIKLTNSKVEKINERNPNISLGEKELISFNSPKEWDNLNEVDDTNPQFSIKNISKTGYDSIFYFIEKNTNTKYNTLKIDKSKKIFIPKKETDILLNKYENSVVIDSAYYVETLINTDNYSLKVYKNGNKYSSFLNGGDNSTFNFLCLTTTDNSDNPVDYKIIYFNNTDDILSYKRFFYIDEKQNIFLKDFSVNELTTEFINFEKIKISQNGIFEKNNH